MKKVPVQVASRELILSNLEKVFWPEENITKGDLINYYHQISPYLLPHLKDRPITMNRYPDGINGKNFYQKDCPEYAPQWIQTARDVTKEEKSTDYILVQDLGTLIWLVNLGCIEMHPWLSTVHRPEFPTFMVFDLDPGEKSDWSAVVNIALLVKESLLSFGLTGWPKTSGSGGLHIFVPVEPKYSFQQIQRSSGYLAKTIAGIAKNLATTERTVAKREGRIYIDYLQNARSKTIASVYSVRPVPKAQVSFPVSWGQLEKEQVHPAHYHLRNVPALLKTQGDLFSQVLIQRQNLEQILTAVK